MKQVRNINLYGWGLGLLLALAACSDEETNLAPQEGNATMTFRLSTRADEEGAASTEQHTHLYVAERLSEHSGIDNTTGDVEIPLYCDKDFTIEGNSYSVTNLLGQWYKFAFVCVPFADMLKAEEENFNEYYLDDEKKLFLLLTRMQDEVHRYAITTHIKKRNKSIFNSVFDDIDGIGEKRKEQLIKAFPSISELKNAKIEELEQIVPKESAKMLYEKIRSIN